MDATRSEMACCVTIDLVISRIQKLKHRLLDFAAGLHEHRYPIGSEPCSLNGQRFIFPPSTFSGDIEAFIVIGCLNKRTPT